MSNLQSRLDRRYRELEKRSEKFLPGRQAPTSVHRMAVDAIGDLMKMGLMQHVEQGAVSPSLKMLLRVIDRARPTILEELSQVPSEELIGAMRMMVSLLSDLVRRMEEELESGSSHNVVDAHSDPALSDIAPQG